MEVRNCILDVLQIRLIAFSTSQNGRRCTTREHSGRLVLFPGGKTPLLQFNHCLMLLCGTLCGDVLPVVSLPGCSAHVRIL